MHQPIQYIIHTMLTTNAMSSIISLLSLFASGTDLPLAAIQSHLPFALHMTRNTLKIVLDLRIAL
jgi:hypothetical protein